MHQREDALRQREETFRKRLNEELDTQVRQARKEIETVIDELKSKAAAMTRHTGTEVDWPAIRPPSPTTGETGTARSDARAAVDAIAKRILAGEAATTPQSHDQSAVRNPQSAGRSIAAGDRVIVGGLGLEAIVTAVHDGTADLDVRGKRMAGRGEGSAGFPPQAASRSVVLRIVAASTREANMSTA